MTPVLPSSLCGVVLDRLFGIDSLSEELIPFHDSLTKKDRCSNIYSARQMWRVEGLRGAFAFRWKHMSMPPVLPSSLCGVALGRFFGINFP